MPAYRRTAALILLALFSIGSAPASVIYDWQPISNNDGLETDSGQVILTDQAYRAGSAYFDGWANYPIWEGEPPAPPEISYPDSPIEHASLRFQLPGWPEQLYVYANPPYGSERNADLYYLTADFTIVDAGLSGSLRMASSADDFGMTGDDNGLWTLYRANSDAPNRCGQDGCSGATGRWTLDPSSVPRVSEPGSLGLFALALLGVLVGSRRRKHGPSLANPRAR
ncbi:PEP-CTERM sorting domain-containing protein [Salinisphaera sp. SPP-AMP-43]|uniref:PEP-CTERM sorting domain-containing protein n=1 Tax=Salinisphaera sp. SPP-AMP-43 TaxID=3121288 RepID=UPI003C6E6D9F